MILVQKGMTHMTFNDKLTERRRSKGWSQEQLGEMVNVSRQTVSKWELGLTTPEMENLIELSNIFDITIDELVGKSPAREKVMMIPVPKKKQAGFSERQGLITNTKARRILAVCRWYTSTQAEKPKELWQSA